MPRLPFKKKTFRVKRKNVTFRVGQYVQIVHQLHYWPELKKHLGRVVDIAPHCFARSQMPVIWVFIGHHGTLWFYPEEIMPKEGKRGDEYAGAINDEGDEDNAETNDGY